MLSHKSTGFLVVRTLRIPRFESLVSLPIVTPTFVLLYHGGIMLREGATPYLTLKPTSILSYTIIHYHTLHYDAL